MSRHILLKSDEFSIIAEDHICYLSFSAQASKNAVSLSLASQWEDLLKPLPARKYGVLEEFIQEKEVVLVIFQSTVPGIFSSGGHLKDLSQTEKKAAESYARSVTRFCRALHSLSCPSLTILQGPAYGGGVELALATDFRWAVGDNVQFHFLQTGLGVPGGWGGMLRLTELNPSLSPRKVNAYFLAKEVLSLSELRHLYLVDECFSTQDLCMKKIFTWRDQMLRCSRELRYDFAKRTALKTSELELYDDLFFQKYFLSAEHRKSIDSFLKQKS